MLCIILYILFYCRFPCNPVKRAMWLDALKLKSNISKRSVICSTHFKEEFFDRTSLVCVRLKNNAIPHVSVLYKTFIYIYRRSIVINIRFYNKLYNVDC